MAYDHAKDHPNRPVLFDGDFPSEPTTYAGIEAASESQYRREVVENYPSIQFEFARDERLNLARQHMSGPLGQRWPGELGAQSPREMQLQADQEVALRRLNGGLPDEPDVPVAVQGGTPFRFEG